MSRVVCFISTIMRLFRILLAHFHSEEDPVDFDDIEVICYTGRVIFHTQLLSRTTCCIDFNEHE